MTAFEANDDEQRTAEAVVPSTRRALREAEEAARRRSHGRGALERTARPVRIARPVVERSAPQPGASMRRPSRKRTVVNTVIMTAAAGIIATMALPAYAMTPSHSSTSRTSAEDALRASDPQAVLVADSVAAPAVATDTYTATTPEELAAAKAAKEAAARAAAAQAAQAAAAQAARQQAATQLQQYATGYTGPSAAQYVAQAAHPAFSLAAVFATGQRYIGTPYVFGGSTPAGFDCSGFVMFVYSQFGIDLPHSVVRQAAIGTPIPRSEAQPGDVIVLNDRSHDGFYAGPGMIMDAPKPGGRVSIRKIWTDDYTVYRFGI